MQFSTNGKILKDAVRLLSKFNSNINMNGKYVRIIDKPGLTMLNMTVTSGDVSAKDTESSRASINIKINDNDNSGSVKYSDTAYLQFKDLKTIANLADREEYLVFNFYNKDRNIVKVVVGDGVVTIPYKEDIPKYNDLNASTNLEKDEFVNLAGYHYVNLASIVNKVGWGCTLEPSIRERLRNVLIKASNKGLTFLATNSYVVNRKKYISTDNQHFEDERLNKDKDATYRFAIDGMLFKQLATINNSEQSLEVDVDTKQLVYRADNIFITFDSADTSSYHRYNFNSIIDGKLSELNNKVIFTKAKAKSLMTAIKNAMKANDKLDDNVIMMIFKQADNKIVVQSLKSKPDDLIKFESEIPIDIDTTFTDKKVKKVAFAINGKYILNAIKVLYNEDKTNTFIDKNANKYTIKFSNDCLKPIAITDSADNNSHENVNKKEEYVEIVTPILLASMRKDMGEE